MKKTDYYKRELLAMALRGEDKPKKGDVLYSRLNYYLHTDVHFREELETANKLWFTFVESHRPKLVKEREKFINSNEKPAKYTYKHTVLYNFMRTDTSFRSRMLELHPDWFPKLSSKGENKRYALH